MDIKGKPPVILLIILTLVFLVSGAFGFYLYNKEHQKNIELEEKIEELNTKYKISEAKFLEAQKVLSNLELKLNDANKQITDLTNELSQERASKVEAATNLDQIRSELDTLKSTKFELEDKLIRAQDELVSIQAKLGALASEKESLEAKVKEFEESSTDVELGKIVVSPEAAASGKSVATTPKPLEGKVLVVNKEYNFVVVNIGSKDGIALGQVFAIYQGNAYIGDIKIEKLHDSMAAAGFLQDDTKNKVREGDKVVKKI
ncbi:MAG: hypothetical protein FJZ12_00040 [Candidatus Omnitrophica bacterium]|nr:hypothetical protein [Candidatus Omnitrophota bacterium]